MAAPDFSFRPASEADFEDLVALRVLVMRAHLERLGRFDEARSRARLRRTFQPAAMRLVFVNDIVVGDAFAGCVSLKTRDDGLFLEHFYLHPDFQGRGLGSAILARLIDEADRRSLPIRLDVLRQSPAARFYERHGFVRTSSDAWDDYYCRMPVR